MDGILINPKKGVDGGVLYIKGFMRKRGNLEGGSWPIVVVWI